MGLPAQVSQVERMLATIETPADAANVQRAAAAMKELARQAGLSLGEQNRAAEAKIRAEARGGELLSELEREQGGSGRFGSSNGGQTASPYAQALAKAGITRQEANRWQRLAAVERHGLLDDLLAACTEARQEITTAYMLRAWRRELKVEKPEPEAGTLAVSELHELIEAGERFATIYADPPWLYGNQGTRGATGDHYPGMTPTEVAALPVRELVADNAHLHLWTTNAFLFDAREVIEAWGFEYKSCFIWVKPQMGMGNYWRVSHEFCLLGVRGSAPFGSRSQMSWREWPRRRHSSKPGAMYELIEGVSPGPYLELFARARQRRGWTFWGNDPALLNPDLFFQESA